MKEKIRRINNFLSFLKATWGYLIWTGIGMAVVGFMIFSITQDASYVSLSFGLIIAGLFISLKSIYCKYNLPSMEDYSSKVQIDHENQELKKRVALFSFVLILSLIVCIVIIFANQYRFLLTALIPIILYTAIEYIIHTLFLFRLGILKDEIFKE